MSYGIAVKALDRAGGPHRAGGQDFLLWMVRLSGCWVTASSRMARYRTPTR